MELSNAQGNVVIDPNHTLTKACPGSGKTRMVIAKILYLLKTTTEDIGAVTFTNKAAGEIKERLHEEVREANLPRSILQRVTVNTFHGMFIDHIQKFNPQYRMIPEHEQDSLLHSIYLAHYGESIGFNSFLSYVENPERFSKDEDFEKLRLQYVAAISRSSKYGLNDIIAIGVEQITQQVIPPLPFGYLLVDEFQDVDMTQLKAVIVHGMLGVNLTLVGDDDQAIYNFRGSLGARASELVKRKLDIVSHELVENYRSAEVIIKLSDAFVAKNDPEGRTELVAMNTNDGVVQYRHFKDKTRQAMFVCDMVRSAQDVDTMIIGRTNKDLDDVEVLLLEAGVKYKRTQSNNYFDNLSCSLYKSIIDEISKGNIKKGLTEIFNILPMAQDDRDRLLNSHNPYQHDAAVKYEQIIPLFKSDLNHGLTALAEALCADMKTQRYKYAERVTDLADLLAKLQGNVQLRLRTLSMGSQTPQNEQMQPKISLLSMHASKGLEATRVFVVGLHGKSIPKIRLKEGNVDQQLKEERNLLFVAMTRAKQELYLSGVQGTEKNVNHYGYSPFYYELEDLQMGMEVFHHA